MTIRRLLVATLKETPAIDAIVHKRVYPTGSLGKRGIPAEPPKPYMMYKVTAEISHQAVRETSSASDLYVEIFVYDKGGSFTRINTLLDLVRENVVGLAGQTSDTGARCLDSLWTSNSQDGVAPEPEDTIWRSARFKITAGSPVPVP